jgi:hypothetical protein
MTELFGLGLFGLGLGLFGSVFGLRLIMPRVSHGGEGGWSHNAVEEVGPGTEMATESAHRARLIGTGGRSMVGGEDVVMSTL